MSENATRAYNANVAEINEKIAELRLLLRNHARRQKRNQTNWDYVSDLQSVIGNLDDANDTLVNAEIDDDDKPPKKVKTPLTPRLKTPRRIKRFKTAYGWAGGGKY